MFTFVHSCGTNRSPAAFRHGTFRRWEEVADFPIVLIVEDDASIQSIVEDALSGGWV